MHQRDGRSVGERAVVFFFSSRRRHTRFDCDWSSDVCSSDLAVSGRSGAIGRGFWDTFEDQFWPPNWIMLKEWRGALHGTATSYNGIPDQKIGRASCRERV